MQLFHRPFCPQSRFIRLVLAETGIEPELIEEKTWERREDFLRLNPAGTTPVLLADDLVLSGAGVIAEYLDETRGLALGAHRLLPDGPAQRAEVRRLLDWFHAKFFEEVSHPWLNEMIEKRFMPADLGGGPPQPGILRAARANIRYHLRYIGWLTAHRNWLVGDGLSLADLAAAAHLSVVDYGGDVPWDEDENARHFYARMKSRPSFRALLADRVAGMPPSANYTNLDF